MVTGFATFIELLQPPSRIPGPDGWTCGLWEKSGTRPGRITVGSAPALSVSWPAQRHSRYNLQTRQVTLCDPLHRRLGRLCYLRHRSDCYRVERSSSLAGLTPAVDQRLFKAHCNRLIV